jgi:hypothetical protein
MLELFPARAARPRGGALSGRPAAMTASSSLPRACLVADREHLEQLADLCVFLGGSWSAAVDAWREQPRYAYLVLLTDTPERIKRRAPEVMLAADNEALRRAIEQCCQKLNDVRCAWVRLIGAEAFEIIDQVIRADVIRHGRAQ